MSPSPLDCGLRRSGLNVRRSIQGHALDAQQKMAQGVSTGPLLAKIRPVEHPAKHFQALRLALRRGIALNRIVAPVMAVQVQRAMLAEAEGIHPQRAVVQQGVGFALEHLGHAHVDHQHRLLRDQRQHVAVGHRHADCIVGPNPQPLQRFCRQAQVFAGDWAEQAVMQFVVRHLDQPAMVHQQRGRRRRVQLSRPGVAQDRAGVLGPFARVQPAAMHTEQVCHFVQPCQGHAALDPIVDVLRCDAALGSEIGRGKAAFVKQGPEAVTGGLHASECSGAVPARIST